MVLRFPSTCALLATFRIFAETSPLTNPPSVALSAIKFPSKILPDSRRTSLARISPLNQPTNPDEWTAWENMIIEFLKEGYLCSLDIPIKLAEEFLEGPLVEYNNFIPQLRVPVPYVKQWNYNTMLKIDDKDFKATNPGVWCHRLHNLLDDEKFTDWIEYGLDKPLL